MFDKVCPEVERKVSELEKASCKCRFRRMYLDPGRMQCEAQHPENDKCGAYLTWPKIQQSETGYRSSQNPSGVARNNSDILILQGWKRGQNTPKVTNLDRIWPNFVTPKVLPSPNCGQKSKEEVYELEQTFLKCLISSSFMYIYEAKHA